MAISRAQSFQPAGHLFATAVALALWNWRTVRGAQAVGPLGEPAEQTQRVALAASTPPGAFGPAPEPAPPTDLASQTDTTPPIQHNLEYFVGQQLKHLEGWQWAEQNRLQCPAAKLVPLTNLRTRDDSRAYAVFRAQRSHCNSCPLRAQCTQSTDRRFQKDINVPVSDELLRQRAELLAAVGPTGAAAAPQRHSPAPKPAPPVPMAKRWRPPEVSKSGNFTALPALLLPAELRRRATDLARNWSVVIHIKPGPAATQTPQWLAASTAMRQNRRKTWAEQLAANALPPTAQVTIEIARPAAARSMAGAARSSRKAA